HHEHRELIGQDREPEAVLAGREPRPRRRVVRALLRRVAEHDDEGDDRGDERGHRRRGRDVAGLAARDAAARERDRRRRRQRKQQAGPGGAVHPRSVRSLSTSRSMLRRPIATIIPRPTTTSEAAIAMTAIAKTCPSSCPNWRENAIRARFAPLSMISTL